MNDEEQEAINYYRSAVDTVGGLKYRLDGEDVISRAIDTLRGGVKSKVNGKKTYYDAFRCMNDLGIQRARMVLESGVNKINHLTKYTDKDMIFRQIRSMVNAWLFEVTFNMKKWSPSSEFDEASGQLINKNFDKIKNKRLVIQTIEHALLQSMLRGTDGFEASLTSKQFSVHELNDNRPPKSGGGLFSGMFGGKSNNSYGGEYNG